jgi:transcription elongation factor Elf1
MDEKEKHRRKRLRKTHSRFGTSKPACVICGESNVDCLELHEPGGRKYSKLRVIICRNCHRKLSNDARDHFPPIWIPPDPLERLSHALLGEADLLARLSEKRRADARMLNELSRKDIIGPESGDNDEIPL